MYSIITIIAAVLIYYLCFKYKEAVRELDLIVSQILSFREDKQYLDKNSKKIFADFEKKIKKEKYSLFGRSLSKEGTVEFIEPEDWLWNEFPNKMKSYFFIKGTYIEKEVRTVLSAFSMNAYDKILDLYKENKEMIYEKYKNMSYASRCKFIKIFLGITGYSRQDIVNYCFDKGGISVKLSRSDELKIALYGDIIETVDNMFRKFEMIEKANEQCKRKKK